MMHTMQALEKTSRRFLCPVCTHRINVGRSQSPRWEKQAGAEGKGGNNTHHSAHQTPGSAFLNPRLALACCPSAPLLRLIHPPLATLGHESRLCVTAHNIPCQKCFPKASTLVTLSAAEEPPHYPLMECAPHFLQTCQQFLAGWPDTAAWQCLRCASPRVPALAYIYV